MHNRFTLYLSLLFIFVLVAGCVPTSSPKAPVLPSVQTQTLTEDQLSGPEIAALTALELVRQGVTPETGAIRLAPGANVSMAKPEPGFTETQSKVTNVRTMSDGSTLIEVLRYYEDGKGRAQMLMDAARYTVRQATDGEAQANAMVIITGYRSIMKSGSVEVRQQTKEAVKAFQQSAGLSVDGVLGPNTAIAMAKDAGIQEFSVLASAPAYSQSPRFTLYIMDEVVAKNDPDTYLKGFDSIEAVRTKAIPAEQFASRAKGGGNFLAMIYFHDQLPKDTPIQIGFSEFSNRKDTDYRATMRPVYSTGQNWPLVLVPFKLDRVGITPKKLYAHIIVNSDILESTQLR